MTLLKRQKLLLSLLEKFGGNLSGQDLQKYLFLFTQIYQKDNNRSYEFVPYQYGCFSFQSYADRRRLKKIGAIGDVDGWKLINNDDYASELDDTDRKDILSFFKEFKDIKGNRLIRHVYKKYPYYAINSKIADTIMDNDELNIIEESRPNCKDYKFFTIGYEGKSFENYLNRLIKNNVKILCDVRKNPISRKYGFSRSTLSRTVNKLGIDYVHMPELGIVSEKRRILERQEDYDLLFDDYERTTLKKNRDAIERLYKIFLHGKRVAITCFEAEPCMCHRSRVAEALSKNPAWKYQIEHI